MTLRFGTDGVRGPADELTDPLVVALGRAAARVLAPTLRGAADRPFVIARDTRESGPRIAAALAAGLEAEGVATEALGVAPTPAVAWLATARDVPGAMISASHNPYTDNGIKFFAAGGLKLTDAVEERLEAELDRLLTEAPPGEVAPGWRSRSPEGGADVTAPGVVAPGWRSRSPEGGADVIADVERYALAVVDSIEGRSLEGLHVVVDCANGAASALAPTVLRRLGARTEVIHAEPDGRNINDGCGSTHPADLADAVVAAGADVGLAFDGDADRVLSVDETGALIDGDHLIALCAIDRHERGLLTGDTVVVTVMANLGFRRAMERRGIHVVETAVGDRYVLEAIEAGGYSLGGEQSGHVIFRELATTGDGLLTGVQVLDLLVRADRPLSQMAADAMTRLPQVLRNVRVARRDPAILDAVAGEIAAVERELGPDGRVLVRASGTEPLVRVMVEATDTGVAERAAARLAAAVGRSAPQ
jgi:phosphoglucosamine mutase